MNNLEMIVTWVVAQVTLFSLVGAIFYLLARRSGPAIGARMALLSLGLIAAISCAAFVPTPNYLRLIDLDRWADWSTPTNAASATAPSDGERLPSAIASELAPNAAPTSAAASWQAYWRQVWKNGPDDYDHGLEVGIRRRWRWTTMIALVIAVSMTLAFARIAAAMFAIGRLRRGTARIGDSSLETQLDLVRAELSCRAAIELRESHEVETPATVGWRRPVILLPPSWRGWSSDELRVVLAHEVAHIARGDYFSWIVAQCCLALHSYHPLVHWLAGRLRMDQEIEADRRGAEVIGCRRRYMSTLAEMALRLDSPTVAWAARPFLPAKGAFLRRIEMLRDQQNRMAPASRRAWQTRRAVWTLGLFVAAFVVIGMRRPDSGYASTYPAPNAAVADGGAATSNASAPAPENLDFQLQYVPNDTAVLIAARPARLLALPGMAPISDLLRSEMRIQEQLGFPLEFLDQAMLCVRAGATPDQQLTILHSRQAVEWKTLIDNIAPSATLVETLGVAYYRGSVDKQPVHSYGFGSQQPMCAAVMGGQTILIGPQATLVAAIGESLGQPRQRSWSTAWNQVSQAATVVLVDVELLRAPFEKELNQAGANTPQAMFLSIFRPLLNQVNHACLGANLNDELGFRLIAQCQSPDAARNVQNTAQALITLGANRLAEFKGPAQPEEVKTGLMKLVISAAEELAQNAKWSIEGQTLSLTSSSRLSSVPILGAVIAPAAASARQSAQLASDQNKLRQIALAMHAYASVHGHFPAASILGPDGKTPHSWRVELLPYLEQDALYREYRLDEPWDSQANQRVLAKMPSMFAKAGAPQSETSTHFLVPVGKETIFSSPQGTKISEIKDGLSQTVMLLETATAVPWTKPEDLNVDLSKSTGALALELAPALPALVATDGAATRTTWVLADGSGHTVQSLTIETFRAMMTKAGGEVVFDVPNQGATTTIRPTQ